MLRNISNINRKPMTAPEAQALSVRKDSGAFPGHLLIFCACPQCGAKMMGDGHDHFFCENHSGEYSRSIPVKNWETNVPVTLIYQHNAHNGTLTLLGARRNLLPGSKHTDNLAWMNDVTGIYPVEGPAGSIA